MKILSWNVNGLRAVLKKDFYKIIEEQNPDIVCLQEIKLSSPEQVKMEFEDYDCYWNCATEKKGYSGTAIFSKIKPISITNNLNIEEHDKEGRVITFELEDYYLITVYTPNVGRTLARMDYRQKWDADFLTFIKKLEEKKPVIFCGDLNVAHKEIDLARPKQNKKNAGFTIEERTGFDNLLEAGFVDTFRNFTEEAEHYTWWSYQSFARKNNVGWRIDYFIASSSLCPKIKSSVILPKIMGSDHCPVCLEI